jgi:hypothetical protein
MMDGEKDGDNSKRLTKTERLELGRRIMELTKVLEISMEEIDKGRDLRSFKTWSSNFSLRSGVSARRRYVIDTASVLSTCRETGISIDDESAESEVSGGSLDGVDADTLLLGLAARDEIWRKQVIDALEKAIHDLDHCESEIEEAEPQSEASGIDEALTEELGNFLFGESMSKIVKQQQNTFALPPNEITRVLFDLTTNLATKAPDEITVFGAGSRMSSNISSFQSGGTTRTDGKTKAALRADIMLANRYVLDEALPRWLKSFRPLPLTQRRALWPLSSNRPDSMPGTYTGQQSEYTGRLSDGDAMTLDSGGSHTQISSLSKKKNLVQLVEDHQLDGETRSET